MCIFFFYHSNQTQARAQGMGCGSMTVIIGFINRQLSFRLEPDIFKVWYRKYTYMSLKSISLISLFTFFQYWTCICFMQLQSCIYFMYFSSPNHSACTFSILFNQFGGMFRPAVFSQLCSNRDVRYLLMETILSQESNDKSADGINR